MDLGKFVYNHVNLHCYFCYRHKCLIYEDRVKPLLTQDLMPRRPFAFHVRYYWSGQIKYQIHNPDVDVSWTPPEDGATTALQTSQSPARRLRAQLVTWARRLFSQTARNRRIDVIPLLRCPTCLSEKGLVRRDDGLQCEQCAAVYPMKSGAPVMYPQ